MDFDSSHLRYDSNDESDSSYIPQDSPSHVNSTSNFVNQINLNESRFVVSFNQNFPEKEFDSVVILLDLPINDLYSRLRDFDLAGAIQIPLILDDNKRDISLFTNSSADISKIYLHKDKKTKELRVVASTELLPEFHFGWTQTLFQLISVKNVEIFGFGLDSYSGYKNKNLHKFYSEPVSEGAIVLGLPACISNYCNFRKIPVKTNLSTGVQVSALASKQIHADSPEPTDFMYT
ncbi:hypothetical protein BB560_004081 [Smittium megazygosporum]|uniref:Uncharacterized protein n=1 Tax=Smittium megazygosporum TaxID=133381 RepID=A0A2T9ZA80_9FUNG|nr:hypothetical protein BB560_004081 [Smittium megazygosporum]